MKKQSIFKITSLFMLSIMLLTAFASCFALGGCSDTDGDGETTETTLSGGDLTRLNVAKSVYAYSEPINISAVGSGKDWVGIYYPEAVHSLYWAYIDEAANKGVGSGVEFDIRKAPKKNSDAPEILMPGKYVIRLMPNDSENVATAVAWVEIIIKQPTASEADLPSKPVSVEYKLADSKSGYSEGELTVTVAEDEVGEDIICYWANNKGILADYTPLAKFKITGRTTVRNLPPNTLIPSNATRLLVYTSVNGIQSEECYEVKLPNGAASKALGEPIFEFQVVSDVHINASDGDRNNAHYVKMLEDIVKVSPESIGVFIVGDMANSGYASEWATFADLHASVEGAPNYYLAIGNHDLYNGSYEKQIELFLNYAKLPDGESPDSCHYDFWLENFHYVFLGNDAGPVGGTSTTLTAQTLEWLDETLAEDRDEDRPTFLFLHQSIYNTIAGSLPGQGWDGVVDYNALSAVLKKYPEVIMFNGHSHWTLDSESCMYTKTEELPTIFNTASVAYLWTSYDVVDGENLEGSQGYYIRVYHDKIAVLGRDFSNGKWVSSAQFIVEYGEQAAETGCSSTSGVLAYVVAICTLFAMGIIIKKH